MGYKSVFKCINFLTALFEKHNITSPKVSAELILGSVLNKNRTSLYLDKDLNLTSRDLKNIINFARRRLKSEPIQYILGKTEFFGLTFYVDKSVLIPRPETELLVEAVVESLSGFSAARILDIGTGSGAIPVSIAKNADNVSLVAADISEAALLVAKKNAEFHRVTDSIVFVESDIYSSFSQTAENFDIIISNPPYIDKADMEKLETQVREFEPQLALFGGEDGLVFYRRILQGARKYLNDGGFLFLEIGYNQAKDLKEIATEAGLKFDRLIKDYNDFDRVLVFRKN